MKPICYDLYCGLGGWADGFIAEGYEVIGFDIEAHDYGTGGYPGELCIRDVRSIHGSELKDATCIVGSSPCQEFSYRAMPWKRAKALPPPYLGMELFNAQFRIQREASEAAGHHIPMVVENVRGAQKWVGRAAYHYGSFYLWGDVPALMPIATARVMKEGVAHRSNGETNFHGSAARAAGVKVASDSGRRTDPGKGAKFTTRDCGIEKVAQYDENTGNKMGGDWLSDPTSTCWRHGSKSPQRKAASAMIAKIPFPLALHIARTFKP